RTPPRFGRGQKAERSGPGKKPASTFGSIFFQPSCPSTPCGPRVARTTGICYIKNMTTRSATKAKRRRTTTVPVTTMEEVPVLSGQERAELTNSLQDAEDRVKAGKAIDYDPKTFKNRLIGIYRAAKR